MLQRKIKQSVRKSKLSFKSMSWVWNGDQPTNHNVESKPVKMQKKTETVFPVVTSHRHSRNPVKPQNVKDRLEEWLVGEMGTKRKLQNIFFCFLVT